jgi:hypothetical protein
MLLALWSAAPPVNHISLCCVSVQSILSNYWIELDPSTPSHEEVESTLQMVLVLKSRAPIKLRLKPHAAS